MAAALDAGRFEDPSWVAAWDVEFACFYLDALELHGKAPERGARAWRLAFGADPGLPPEAHVLLGMNAHINYDLPQSLVAVIPPGDFASPSLLDRRRRDHERIDDVLAARVGEEDARAPAGGWPPHRARPAHRAGQPAGQPALPAGGAEEGVGSTPGRCTRPGWRATAPTRSGSPTWRPSAPSGSPTCCAPARCCCAWRVHGFGVTLD